MIAPLQLLDAATRDDLRIFLQRILRSGEPDVRVVTRGAVLAVFGCTQAPRGLADAVPVVLVMRGFALSEPSSVEIDATVSARSVLDRIARLGFIGLSLELPEVSSMVAWAGVLPPVSGWQPRGIVDPASVAQVAADGIRRVANALPDQPGEALVARVRKEVWGSEMLPGVPAAAAFAAESMGLIGGEPLRVAATLTWTRLTSERGSVLVRGFAG